MAEYEGKRDFSPTAKPVQIVSMRPEDWQQIRTIYEQGIATGNATFETSAPDWTSWDAKHLVSCRLVARRGGELLGWAALSHVSSRPAYRGVAEVSVYVSPSAHGQRIGSQLLSALVEASEAAGVWTLQAGIFPENPASLALHANHGFRRVGIRERIGCLNSRWRDVVLMERRSQKAGL